MTPRISTLKFLGLSLLATLLGSMIFFLATPLMRVLRNVGGSRLYWVTGVLFSPLIGLVLKSPLNSFMIFSIWMGIGLYSEIEERGFAGLAAGFFSLVATVSFNLLGPYLWISITGQDLMSDVRSDFDVIMSQIVGGSSGAKEIWFGSVTVNTSFLMKQIPSLLFVVHLVGLVFSLALDSKIASLFKLRFERIVSSYNLLEFKVPDYGVWITMLAFLVSFLRVGWSESQAVALNIFTVMAALYFFQGLAILEVGFIVFRAGPITKLLFYFLLVGQLFFVLSAIGFIDYWVDFRKRLRKRKISKTNSNNGEHI